MSNDIAKKSSTSLIRSLERVLSKDRVLTSEEALEAYSGDKWFARARPLAVVLPDSTKQVSAIFRMASKAGVPVTPRGAGYGYVGGCVPSHGGLVISAERMNRILEISADDFVAVVEAGVVTGDLQKAVRALGLEYPPDPASLRHCSIGGNIATNAGGPKCLKYGVTRNYVLGLEVVLADGRVVKCGGRTHKNKTGFDLVGLFTGSEGLLGFVTKATLRLIPKPPSRAVLVAGFADMPAAARAIGEVFSHGFLPAALEVADEFTLNAARSFRQDAAFPRGKAMVIVEVDGQPSSVKSEAKTLANILKKAGAMDIQKATTASSCEALWSLRRAFSESLKATGLKKLNEDIAVPRGRLVDLMKFATKLQKETGFPIACFGHAGDGNIHVNIMVGNPSDPAVQKHSRAALDKLFRQVLAWEGAITGEHGVGIAKKPWWNAALTRETRALHHTLKNAMDPQGIINPGKFL